MLKLLAIAILILFLLSRLLPRLGANLGRQARKPFRQARWMWNWLAGSEDDAIAAEYEYGAECAREFAAQFPGDVPGGLQELAARVGSSLERAVDDPRRRFQFRVVSSARTNAYALPGGFVFVTAPLLELCGRDRQEVAFFLGHEVAHVVRGHAREQLAGNVFLSAVASRVPHAGQMLRQVLGKGYSRELELEADREGARLAVRAGFEPSAAVRALERLARLEPGLTAMEEFFSTHPPFAERIRQLRNGL